MVLIQYVSQEEGYDDLESLTLLSAEEVDELCAEVKMKPGHRRKMPVIIERAKEEVALMLRDETIKIGVLRGKAEIRGEEAQLDVAKRRREIENQKEGLIGSKDVKASEHSKGKMSLPKGKRYAYFASHKVIREPKGSCVNCIYSQKSHTRFGNSSADLARASKDVIKLKYGLDGYFGASSTITF